jgi:hypothetical protein
MDANAAWLDNPQLAADRLFGKSTDQRPIEIFE